jgi:hypothetical protein
MEPNITSNSLGLTDFTGCALREMGWQGSRCADTLPVAKPRSVNGTEDTASPITLLGGDPDSTGAITYSIVAQPSRGTLTPPASLASTTGVVFTYTPTANLNGTDSFTYQVSDGANQSNIATVTISVAAVNDAPVANAQTVSASANMAISIMLSGSDVEGSPLTYAIVTPPANGALSGTAPNLTYTPSAGFSGTNTFTFRVSDGVLNSADATVTINVAAPPAPSGGAGGGGGGGSVNEMALVLLLLLWMWRLAPMRCTATVAAPTLGKRRA